MKLSTGILLLLGLFAGFIGLAPSASAHHPEITGSVECGFKVNWTAYSWSNTNGEGDHSNVIVEYELNDSGTWTQVPSGSPGSFDVPSNPAYDPFSGSFTAPGTPTNVQLRVRTPGDWGNGSDGGQTTYTSQLNFPTSCGDLDLTVVTECAAGGVSVTIKNNGSSTSSTTLTYTQSPGPDSSVSTGDIAPGASKTVTLPILENSSYTISFSGGNWGSGGKPANIVDTRDCQTPPAPTSTVTWECGAANATVQVSNSGQESVTATITKNGVAVHTNVAVPGSYPVSMAGSENSNVTIKVTFSDSGTGTDVTKTFTVDCDKPKPTISAPVCAQGGWNVTLGNVEGTDTATFTVTVNGTPTNVNVAAGQSTVHPITAAEGSTISLAITSGSGNPTYTNASLTRDCQKPAATAVFSCTALGVVVNVTNTGSEAATVNITGQSPVVVAAGGSHNVTIPVAEDAAYSITVTSNGQTLASASGTRDCQKPAATVVFECAQGGVVVKLTNAGEQAATVAVNGESVNVPAGTTAANPVTRVISVAEGASYDITVLGQTASGIRDCEKPTATAVFSCAEGGVVVTLTNPGAQSSTTVKVNGVDHTIAPDATETIEISVPEGESYNVTVTQGGTTLASASGVRDCEKPAATVVFECAQGGVVVKLTNAGELAATVDVAGESVSVPAGTTAAAPVTRVISVDEGEDYSITVLGQTASGTRDCEKPAVEGYSVECAEGGVVVTLTNDGELEANVTVDGEPVSIPAGGTVEVLVEAEEGETYDFDIVIDGETINVTGVYDCEDPGLVSATFECAEGGVVVLLTNVGETDTTVTVDGEEVDVPAGTTAEAPVKVVVEVDENADYSIDVVVDGETTTVSGTRDCEQPGIDSFQVECAEGGVVILLTNDGELPTEISVDGETYTVDPGEIEEAFVAVEEDADYSITVTGDELDEVISGTLDCDHPAPAVDDTVACARGGLAVTLDNTEGEDDAEFTVSSPNLDEPVTVTVAAGATEQVIVPVEEDTDADITVTSGDEVLFEDTVTRDCETVQGEVLVPTEPAELPRTGSATRGLLELAGILLLAGVAFVAASRRRGEAF